MAKPALPWIPTMEEVAAIASLIEKYEDLKVEMAKLTSMEPVPDGYYEDLYIEDDGRSLSVFAGEDLGYVPFLLPMGFVLMRPKATE